GLPLTVVNGSATSGSISSLTAGNHSVTAVYSGDNNFVGSTGTLSGGQTVSRAPLTVKAEDKSKTYGDAAVPFTISYTSFVNGEGPSVLGGTLMFNFTDAPTTPAGSHTITPSGLTSSNYIITFADGTLTVNRAPLTVRADDKSKVYGSANPALTVSYT